MKPRKGMIKAENKLKTSCKNLEKKIFELPLQSQNRKREFSSAGSEHLPYKQRVGGSNPSTPTKRNKLKSTRMSAFKFCEYACEFIQKGIFAERKVIVRF